MEEHRSWIGEHSMPDEAYDAVDQLPGVAALPT
jgi:hypothetical protein